MLEKARNIRMVFQEFIETTFKQKKRIFRLGREFSWILAGQSASVLGALVLVRVLTEHLEPDEYGRLALALTIITLFSQCVMSLNSGVGRYFTVALQEKELTKFFLAALNLLFLQLVLVTVLTSIGLIILKLLGLDSWLTVTVAAAVFAFISGFNSCLSSIQTAARQRASVALHSGCEAWLKIGLVFLTITIFGRQCESVVVGYTLALLLVGLSQFYWVKRLVYSEVPVPQSGRAYFWEKRILSFSWPFPIWGVFYWMQSSSDRWSLERFSNTAEVGQYAVLFQLGYAPISLATAMAATFLAPILYQRFSLNHDFAKRHSVNDISWNTTKLIIGCTVLGFMVAMFCHQWIFQLLVAEPFRKASFLFPWIVLAGGLFSAAQMLSLKLMAEMRTQQLLVIKVFTAVLGTGFNILGGWLYGIAGVTAGTLLFSLVYLIWITLIALNNNGLKSTT